MRKNRKKKKRNGKKGEKRKEMGKKGEKRKNGEKKKKWRKKKAEKAAMRCRRLWEQMDRGEQPMGSDRVRFPPISPLWGGKGGGGTDPIFVSLRRIRIECEVGWGLLSLLICRLVR